MAFSISPLTLGLPPAVYAAMAMFCSTDREAFNFENIEAERELDVRVSAFYRPTFRGGFMVQVRANASDNLPFLHLAVVEHGSTGETVVAEWMAPWAQIPPPVPDDLEWPSRFRENDVGGVVDYLIDRMRHHVSGSTPKVHAK